MAYALVLFRCSRSVFEYLMNLAKVVNFRAKVARAARSRNTRPGL